MLSYLFFRHGRTRVPATTGMSPCDQNSVHPRESGDPDCTTALGPRLRGDERKSVRFPASTLSLTARGQVPVENFCAVPAHHAVVAENLRERPLHMTDAMRHAGKIRMAGHSHDFRPLGRLGVQRPEMIERAGVPLVG